MTLYTANTLQNNKNTLYPNKVIVKDAASLAEAAARDYVCAYYKEHKRSIANFVASNCIPMDCDNDHSDDPAEWVSPEDVRKAFPDVVFGVHYSRSHMKQKGNISARPRFHVLFPIPKVTDPAQYVSIKQQVLDYFTFFDSNAADAGRFFFGTANPQTDWFDGSRSLVEFLQTLKPVESVTSGTQSSYSSSSVQFSDDTAPIPEGERNTTLHKYAVKVLKRYGVTQQALNAFLERSKYCDTPLGQTELKAIWKSAQKYYETTIANNPDYIPPGSYNAEPKYKPDDFTDVGQARQLVKHYHDRLRYSTSTEFVVYTDNHWKESNQGAQGMAQELTDLQMQEATALQAAEKKQQGNSSKKKDKKSPYVKHVERSRNSARISACLNEAKPALNTDPAAFDADPFLLNTPGMTYDLRKGLQGARPASPEDLMMKMTAVEPSDQGKEIWEAALDTYFCSDKNLIEYVQRVCGLTVIGRVYVESLIIAHGSAKNGKSSFFNTISRVLGSYSGRISADALTTRNQTNRLPELAEMCGKRLIIAAEMSEGVRLSESMLKQLCSTDEVFAAKKYRQPFSFVPSHTTILYTNHLPKVSASDEGTWRRLIVIPFNAYIEPKDDIRNYSDYLFDNAAGAVLSWVIEGARKIIADKFALTPPTIVQKAIDDYREMNDWFGQFLSEKCDVDPSLEESSSELYKCYCLYCRESNEHTRGKPDFYEAVERANFTRIMRKKRAFIQGLKIKENASGLLNAAE